MGAGRNRPGVSLPPFLRRTQRKRRAAGSPPLSLLPLGSFLRDLGGWLHRLSRFLFRGELLLDPIADSGESRCRSAMIR
jgi:hypothetical protein